MAAMNNPPAIPIKTALNIPFIFAAKMKTTKPETIKAIVAWSLKNGTESMKLPTTPMMKGVTKIAEPMAIISGDVMNFWKSLNWIFGSCAVIK